MPTRNILMKDKTVHYHDSLAPYQTRCGIWVDLVEPPRKRRIKNRGARANPTDAPVDCVLCLAAV